MFLATVFNVMIASPGDVSAERQIVRDVIFGWNAINAGATKIVLLPVGWETHSYPAVGDPPQTILNEQVLAPCDLLVAIFGSRIGTPTNRFPSGTVEEIETHLNSGKPVMLYFSSGPILRQNLDPEQYMRLEEFRESCKGRCLLQTFDNSDDFRQKFSHQLNLIMINEKYFSNNIGSITAPQEGAFFEISDEAKKLLKEATKDQNGHILCHRMNQGTTFMTNKQEFKSEDARTQAAWEDGFQELEDRQLIRAVGPNRIEFKITSQGYKLADMID